MREIKFRAWDKRNKSELSNVAQDWIELMQFTGLKDKYGVKIYEGDVLNAKSMESEEKYVGIVEFNETGYWVFYKRLPTGSKVSISFYTVEDIEVIGNIYENPELVK